MADTDWRIWLFNQLTNDATLTDLVPADNIYGAGGLTIPPKVKPFLVIRLGQEVPGPFPGISRQRTTLWAHDEPGDYLRIGKALSAVRVALVGAGARVGQVVQAGGVACAWQGDSADLSDPDFGTIVRTSDYDLHGKDGNA